MTAPLDPPDPFPFDPRDEDPVAQRLRATLRREADMVRPGHDGYDRITTRLEQQGHADATTGRPSWVAWAVGVAAAVVIGTVAGVLVLGGRDDDPGPAASGPSPSVSASSTTSAPPTTSPSSPSTSSSPPPSTAPSAVLAGVPVYWIGDSEVSSWLYREFRTVPDVGGTVTSAVQQVMSGEPLDPDHRTAWSEPSSLEVVEDGDAITVDVSADAFANTQVGSQEALLAVQQVVWTATAAARSPGPVTILVDGGAYDAWGVVALGEPMTRDATLQAQIWIDSPNEGDELAAGTVTVSGVSRSFEATIQWEVVDRDGTVVQNGFTQGGANETFGPYEVTVDLDAGDFVVHVWSEDVSGGESPEGPRMFEQTRSFTVG